ncbi:uncharacterized protein LOC135697785, partial [Ochlerotatus camptorhynchus]|uniref:uncharacterized protein LOC135697785 n=1 Tax=Ochlerotatus camptorhynchus TaxID=644619 RepID=UPI0031D51E7F
SSKLILISQQPSFAFFGLSVTGFYAPSTTITTSCSNAITTYSYIQSTVRPLRNEAFVTLQLDDISASFFTTYDGLSSRMMFIFSTIKNAAQNESSNIDNQFVQINNTISTALSFISDINCSLWESFFETRLSLDISATSASLQNISQILNLEIYPQLISLYGLKPVPSSSISANIPETLLNQFTAIIDQLQQTEQNTILPSVRTAVEALQSSNTRLKAYISQITSSFTNLDIILSQTWNAVTLLPETYTTTTNRLYDPVRNSVTNFIKAINGFTDLYLGTSAGVDITAVNTFSSSYFANASSETDMVVSKLDRFRSKFSDQILTTTSNILATGYQAMQTIGMLMIQQTNLPICASQLIQPFVDRNAALLGSTQSCIYGANFDFNAPMQTQISVATAIQSDVQYYLALLNGLLTGVTDNSLATTRIAADSHVTAFFSQSNGIIQTFNQQLVNMYVQLNADYDLIVGRSSYCLASKDAEASSVAEDFVSAFQQCLQ